MRSFLSVVAVLFGLCSCGSLPAQYIVNPYRARQLNRVPAPPYYMVYPSGVQYQMPTMVYQGTYVPPSVGPGPLEIFNPFCDQSKLPRSIYVTRPYGK